MASAISTFYACYRVVDNSMKMLSSAYQLMKLPQSWSGTSSTSQVAGIFLKGVISAKDIAMGAFSLSHFRQERLCWKNLRDYQHTLAIVMAPPPSIYYLEPFWFIDDSDQIRRAWAGISKVVKGYQAANAQFEKFQSLSLALSILKSLQQGNIPTQESILLIMNEAHKVLRFHAKAHCDKTLSIVWWAKLMLYPYEALQFALALRSAYQFVKNWALTPTVANFTSRKMVFVFYKIPPLNDPSLQYDRMPVAYHAREPFKNYTCKLTQLPVTRALFVLKNNDSYLFEMQELVNFLHIHGSKEVFFISSINITFAENDVYIDLEFNSELEIEIKKQMRL